jgi:hypothetical protein
MIYDTENNENLDFDNVSFEGSEDDCVELSLTDAGDIELNLTELNDEQDIPVCVNISPKATEKIAEDIEEVLLNLLESGDRDALLCLTGERPDLSSNIDHNLHMDFAAMYSQAVIHNPAIKWYSRLTNILPEDQFFVKNGKLHIHMPKKTFNKVLKPFLMDFDNKFYECSPIVNLVLSCNEKLAKDCFDQTNNIHKQLVRKKDESGLEIEKSGLELFFDTDEVEHAGNVRVDDNNSLNQSDIREVKSSLNLADLSNKAIATYLAEKGMSDSELNEKLNMHIPEKARRNEISVLVNMAKKLNNSPLQHLRPIAMRENPDKDTFKWDSD